MKAEVAGHTLEFDLADDDLVLDVVVILRLVSASRNQGGFSTTTSEGADATVVRGMIHRAGLLQDAADMKLFRPDE